MSGLDLETRCEGWIWKRDVRSGLRNAMSGLDLETRCQGEPETQYRALTDTSNLTMGREGICPETVIHPFNS